MNVLVTAQHICVAALKPVNEANMNSVLVELDRYGGDFGMDRVHRVVQYLAQLMHESGDFRYDREIWGPTLAQSRYDTRTDLGNTLTLDGDGKKYRAAPACSSPARQTTRHSTISATGKVSVRLTS
ncbi:putative chitinase [Rhizobium tibeticum]|uniref:Chitinase n=1 Tax=Rhizobium tibeticum TaxID=501024 RepID=A0A1H8MV84_9HYPH|nr:hypothetical protein [Rhizobium tibeticum]SEI11391.1 putative chitinase [Rhizobium tibeticum]SEO21189.1 putative chitinase [Rhizobium tibeticum]